jgi:pyruvate kinase
MVTMPSEAAADYTLVRDLVASGMNCMRINTAHDHQEAWKRMIGHLERARQETERDCRVLIDLAGPKLRTGPIEPGPPIVKWRPSRDAYGRVVRPARIWLTGRRQPRPAPSAAAATLLVLDEWQAALRIRDSIKLFDARDSMRRLEITECAEGGVWAESDQTAYVVPGTTLHLTCDGPRDGHSRVCEVNVGDLPREPRSIRLSEGDRLVLTRGPSPGRPARRGANGSLLEPATLSVTLPEIFADVRAGESIWFDDGRIGGIIRETGVDGIVVEITHAAPGGSKLAADKGINLPDSVLHLPPLTANDLENLPFVVAHADLVGYSFVRAETDVRELQARLAALGGGHLGIVLKIETRRAFEQLPALLLAAMHSPAAGVMIARGDLAIECGFERLAEIQEEILWLAEASHTPVIWATQVLEHLAQTGVPSRAEITDAAMGERAECVMLNKGPFIVHAVRTLDDILRRMQTHQQKKSAMLRHLGLADRFMSAKAG